MTSTRMQAKRAVSAAGCAILAIRAAGAVGGGYTPPPTQWGYIIGCVMLAVIGALTLIGAGTKRARGTQGNVAIGIALLACSVACGIAAYTFG